MNQKTKSVLLGMAAVAMLGVAVGLYLTRSTGGTRIPDEFSIHGVCLETGVDVAVTYRVGERAPFVNPATGQRTVYMWYLCRDCAKRFVPPLVPDPAGGPPRPPPIPTCPLCGGSDVVAWNPDDPTQPEPVGDAPLPQMAP